MMSETIDEPESEEERQSLAEARSWLKQNIGKGIPHEEAMHGSTTA